MRTTSAAGPEIQSLLKDPHLRPAGERGLGRMAFGAKSSRRLRPWIPKEGLRTTERTEEDMVYIGIDVAKRFRMAATIDGDEAVIEPFGFEQLLVKLAKGSRAR